MPFSAAEKAQWEAERANSPEQAELREEHENGSKRGIRIPAPKEPEINPEIWRDVLPLLQRGFLMQAAEINGILFVFKSLNHHEFEMVQLIGGLRPDKQPMQRFWDIFLAYGVFMVDGHNILLQREQAIPEVAKTFSVFPTDAKQRVVRHLSELNRRASVASTLTEAYAMEPVSRHRWSQVSGLDLMSTALTGVGGSDLLGLNYAQLTWRSLNHYEDLHEQIEREWENAKFIGSCSAGKGIQKVYTQDVDRRRKRREDIVSRKDAVIRYALFGELPSENQSQQGHAVMVTAKTTDELAKQLEMSLRGEKDWHDEIIEAHEKHVREGYQRQQEQLKALVSHREHEFQGLSVVGGTDLEKSFSPAEVQERIVRSRQVRAQQNQQKMVYPQLDEKLAKFHHKWGLDKPVEPSIETTDQAPTGSVVLPPARTTGKPFRR
jgi:hypothetical protein